MFTLFKHGLSILIWVAIAALLILLGKVVYLAFWVIVGAILLLVWLGQIFYKIAFMFNPAFKPIKIVVVFIVIIAAGLVAYKVFIQRAWNRWGSTDKEVEAQYKADEYCPESDLRIVRTVEVNVPPNEIFRWVRQMPETGSYTWSLLDFRGGKNVEKLIEDLPDLREGDRFLIGKVVEVKKNKSITFDIGEDPEFPKMGVKCMYGGYYFREVGDDRTRVSMVMKVDYEGVWGWFYSQVVIEIGDFFMATKQLSRLKELAEKNRRA
jgi:hypothetical protein